MTRGRRTFVLQLLRWLVTVASLACTAVPALATHTDPRSPDLAVGLSFRSPGVPFVAIGLSGQNFSISAEGITATHPVFGTDAHSRMLFILARYRSPIAYHDWAPFLDGGIVQVRSLVQGIDFQADGVTLGVGVERPLDERGGWVLRADVHWLRLLQESRWLVGVGLEKRWDLPALAGGHGTGGGLARPGAGLRRSTTPGRSRRAVRSRASASPCPCRGPGSSSRIWSDAPPRCL